MAGDNSQALSIISVPFPDFRLLEKNIALTLHLNPRLKCRSIAVDNTLKGPGSFAVPFAEILPGVPRPIAQDKGSLHHAMALEKALQEVRTEIRAVDGPRFLRASRGLGRARPGPCLGAKDRDFGSVWHPRWFYQYRDFPSVHFMLIDLHQIPLAQIDIKPLISEDRWWQTINRGRNPWPRVLRDTLKAQRCRDTGWQLYRRYHNDPAVSVETLLPHYVPPANARHKWERRLAPVLRDSWRKYPADSRSYTEESFLRVLWAHAYEQASEGILLARHSFRNSSAMCRAIEEERPADSRRRIVSRFFEEFLN